MNFNKFIEYLNIALQYIRRLNILIFGKPLFDWLKLLLLYSFVIWFSITGWKAYQDFKEYKKLLQQEKNLQHRLKLKQKIVRKYKQKLQDIQTAYNEAKTIFSKDKVNNLVLRVNTEIMAINKLVNSQLLKNSINPYRIKTFNLRYDYLAPLKDLTYFSLKGIPFKSELLNYFKASFRFTYKRWKAFREKPLRGEVDVSLVGNNIILYLKPSINGYLIFKPIFWNGIVYEPQRAYVFPTLSFYEQPLSMKNIKISPLFFGWYLTLSNINGGL
jgi:hypothetical protein